MIGNGGPTSLTSRIEFMDLSQNELYFQRNGLDLKILVIGEDQSITVQDFSLVSLTSIFTRMDIGHMLQTLIIALFQASIIWRALMPNLQLMSRIIILILLRGNHGVAQCSETR